MVSRVSKCLLGLAMLVWGGLACGAVDPNSPGSSAGQSDLSSADQASSGGANEVAVTVNGRCYLEADIERLFQRKVELRKTPAKQMPGLRLQLREEIIDTLIQLDLLAEAAGKAGLTVTAADLDRTAHRRLAQVLRIRSQTREQFSEDLKKNHGITLAEYLGRVKSEPSFRQSVLASKVIGIVTKDITVTEQDVADYYQQHLADEFTSKVDRVAASHILIPVVDLATGRPKSEDQRAGALEKAKQVLTELKEHPEEFAALARRYSGCSSARQGGYLGLISQRAWPKEFSDVAFSLKQGQMSDIVETQFGYHIIKVSGQEKAGEVMSMAEARDGIRARLLRQRRQSTVESYCKGLRDSAVIEYPAGKEPKPLKSARVPMIPVARDKNQGTKGGSSAEKRTWRFALPTTPTDANSN